MSYLPANPADILTTGTITSQNGAVTASLAGQNSVAFILTGTWTGTVVVEGSIDGTNWVGLWFGLPGTAPLSAGIPDLATSTTANGSYRVFNLTGLAQVRVRASSVVTGTINVTLNFSNTVPSHLFSHSAILQEVIGSTLNSSTANLNAGANFTGTGESTLGVAGIQVNFRASQNCTVQMQQSMDNTNWDIVDLYAIAAGVADGRTFQATASYFRIVVTNNGAIATTYLRLQVALCPTVEVVPRALTQGGRLKVDVGAGAATDRIPVSNKWEGTNAPPKANMWVWVASYTIPSGYNFTPYQTQYSAGNSSSLIRVSEELDMGSLNTTTNAFTDGGSFALPQYASYIEVRLLEDVATNRTITITYVNQDGTAGRTATLTLAGAGGGQDKAGYIYLVTLQGTDVGVRDITNISTSSTGTGNLKVYGMIDIDRDSADAASVVYTDVIEIGAYVMSSGKVISLSVSSASTSSTTRYVANLGLLIPV